MLIGCNKKLKRSAVPRGALGVRSQKSSFSIAYLDGTTGEMGYDKLDVQFVKDRLGRWTVQLGSGRNGTGLSSFRVFWFLIA